MYQVTLAKNGQRRIGQSPETCDNCSGLVIMGESPIVTDQPDSSVRRWNVFGMGAGFGTQQFWLHDECAESLR